MTSALLTLYLIVQSFNSGLRVSGKSAEAISSALAALRSILIV